MKIMNNEIGTEEVIFLLKIPNLIFVNSNLFVCERRSKKGVHQKFTK